MAGSPLYRRLRLLAEGPYRRVYFGMEPVKNKFQTITDLEFQHLSDTKKRELLQNLSVIATRNLRHLNLAGYLGYSQNDASLTIISEFMIGQDTLASYIKKHVKFELSLGSSIIRQILEGLAYLNENGLSMGSLNTTDIWIDVKGRVKLSNYGLFETTSQLVQTFCDRADIMALGGIVLEMFNGFPSENSPDNEFAILHPSALLFVKECLSTNLIERPTAASLLHNSPFCILDKELEFKDAALSSLMLNEARAMAMNQEWSDEEWSDEE